MLNEDLLLKTLEVCRENGFVLYRKAIQYIIFSLKKNNKINFEYKFRNHFLGPYSTELEESLSFLKSLRYVEECPLYDKFWYEYKLTEEGIDEAAEIELPQNTEEILKLEVPKLVMTLNNK